MDVLFLDLMLKLYFLLRNYFKNGDNYNDFPLKDDDFEFEENKKIFAIFYSRSLSLYKIVHKIEITKTISFLFDLLNSFLV